MSGGLSAGAFAAAAVAAAGTAASTGLAIASATAGTPGVSGTGGQSDLLSALTGKSQAASQQRSQLLSTAGQSAGSPLAPGSVGGSGNIFGN